MFLCEEEFFSIEECERIADLVLSREEEVLKIPNTNTRTDYTGLTGKYYDFNWLPWIVEELEIDVPNRLLSLEPFQNYNTLWVQCWSNVLRQGEGLNMHNHGNDGEINDFLPAHVFIAGNPNTGTYYKELNITMPSTRGNLHIFNPFDEHKVVLNTHSTPRISLAMDIWYTLHELPNIYEIHRNPLS